MTWAAAGLLGLAFGSFLNVCIHRIPRGESLVSPPSHCPRCRKPIRPWDNIPVLSYLLLGGRCRDCRKPIALRYPAVEAVTAALFLAVYAKSGWSWQTPKGWLLCCLLIVTALIDLDLQIIPFRISVPGVVLGLAGSFVSPPMVKDAVLAALVGAGFIGFAWLLWRYVLAGLFRKLGIDQKEGMGGGDIPYAAMIGAFLGLRALAVALFAAVALGVIIGLVARAAGRNRAGQPIPFGPFLALGALVGYFLGSGVFDWYVRTMLH